MGKKIALNVFYNLVIILSVAGMIWAYQNESLLIVAFFGAVFAAIVVFKLQLMKAIKKDFKNKP
ncbi:MAG: DUF6358 family protein [Pedobacter sp.]|nr:DUF6358 family protein [Pedobacter sp.]MDQ8052661.1 DUF6358 family protein [Pedobacter sp.]